MGAIAAAALPIRLRGSSKCKPMKTALRAGGAKVRFPLKIKKSYK
jgi:hypothetical protein